MPVTKEELIGPDPIAQALKVEGITPKYLAQKLKEELDYLEPKYIADDSQDNPFLVTRLKTPRAMKIRQTARIDAHRLRADYPPEQHHLEGDLNINIIDRFEQGDESHEEDKENAH